MMKKNDGILNKLLGNFFFFFNFYKFCSILLNYSCFLTEKDILCYNCLNGVTMLNFLNLGTRLEKFKKRKNDNVTGLNITSSVSTS